LHAVGVAAAGEDVPAVRREGDAPDDLGVVLVLRQLLAGFHVPEADAPVDAGGDEQLAVGREGDAVDLARVPLEAAHLGGRLLGRAAGRTAPAGAGRARTAPGTRGGRDGRPPAILRGATWPLPRRYDTRPPPRNTPPSRGRSPGLPAWRCRR